MKTVILTSGPRGSGKSTYVELVQKIHPEVKFISRDQLLMEIFGATSLDPYSGGHECIQKIFLDKLKDILSGEDDLKLIVDFWNGYSITRQSLIEIFHKYGAECVVCWQFVLPLDVCLDWFFKKPDVKGYSKYGAIRDYKLYYKEAKLIEKDGFDAVHYINPLQLSIPGFPLI